MREVNRLRRKPAVLPFMWGNSITFLKLGVELGRVTRCKLRKVVLANHRAVAKTDNSVIKIEIEGRTFPGRTLSTSCGMVQLWGVTIARSCSRNEHRVDRQAAIAIRAVDHEGVA